VVFFLKVSCVHQTVVFFPLRRVTSPASSFMVVSWLFFFISAHGRFHDGCDAAFAGASFFVIFCYTCTRAWRFVLFWGYEFLLPGSLFQPFSLLPLPVFYPLIFFPPLRSRCAVAVVLLALTRLNPKRGGRLPHHWPDQLARQETVPTGRYTCLPSYGVHLFPVPPPYYESPTFCARALFPSCPS